jgi:hypothetical protein
MLLTYTVVVYYLRFVVHINPWINAFVSVIGFFLSGIAVSLAKRYGQNEPRALVSLAMQWLQALFSRQETITLGTYQQDASHRVPID